MNITIINCFDTYEHRVDLLVRAFTEDGYKVQVLTSDFKHIEKNPDEAGVFEQNSPTDLRFTQHN